jgi:hypothetical protein
VVALTSPPLISILGASLAAVRRCRFFYWVMDLNPDEAVAAGWLPQHGLLTRLLLYFSALSLRRAERVVVLDGFMRDRVLARGVGPERVTVLPPWSHDEQVYFDPVGRHRFRLAHGLEHQFVVMYSGNLSPCHPLDTLLAAARALADQRDITFCFIGGGSEFRKLEQTLESGQRRRRPAHCNDESCLVETSGNPAGSDSRGEELPNVVCLPYQPLEELSASLSAADLHVVLMGNDFVGLVHPCKVYNVLRVGAPVLYIGPQPSHVTELLAVADSDGTARGSRADGERAVCFCAGHQEVDRVVRYIQNLREIGCRRRWAPADVHRRFSRATILPLLVRALESESAER